MKTLEEQNAFLEKAFNELTPANIKAIELKIKTLVSLGIIDENDSSNILYAVREKSISDFYRLETHPRDQLWVLLETI